MSIRTKLIVWFVSIVVLTGITASIYSIYDDLAEAEDRAVREAESTTRTIALALTTIDESTDHTPIYKSPTHVKDFVDDLHRLLKEDIVLVDVKKRILGDAIFKNVGEIFDHDANNEVGQTIRDGVTRKFIEKSADYPTGILQMVTQLRTEDGQLVGAIILEYTSYYNRYIAEAKRGMLYTSIVIVILTLIISAIIYRLAVTFSKPIIELKNASNKIAAGSLDEKVEIKSKDEIGELASAFNNMVAFRKESEATILYERNKLISIFEAMEDWIYIVNKDLRIEYANPKMEMELGKHGERKCDEYLKMPEDACEICPKDEVFEGKTLRMEWTYSKNGKTYDIIDTPLKNPDGSISALRIFRDITERKEAEEELNRLNKELSDFAYIISHDLKAPLRAIGTISSWLAEDYKDKLDDAGKVQLDLLLNRTKRMHGMIEGILNYSRAGRAMGEPVQVDTRKVIKEVIDSIAVPENIQITIQDSLPVVFFDSLKISQIFQNLISNAIKYMDKPEGQIDVGCNDIGDFYEFYVKDNGPGIEERHFEKIFQIFQTLKPRDEFESTGIGLSIVKKIIEQNGGRIWVESEVGKGSTFRFTIPNKM